MLIIYSLNRKEKESLTWSSHPSVLPSLSISNRTFSMLSLNSILESFTKCSHAGMRFVKIGSGAVMCYFKRSTFLSIFLRRLRQNSVQKIAT